MNELLKDGLMILSGLIGGYLFIKIRRKVINQTKEVIGEKFNLPKFTNGMLNVTSSVGWAKDIHDIFNLRKLIIIGIIIGVIFGYGYYKGQMGKPVVIDWRGKEEFVKLNEHYLHIQKDGSMQVLDKDKKTVLKDIKVKDLDNLRKYLRPYGFRLKPFVTAGGSLGEQKTGFEGGAGVDFFKWFKYNANVFITNLGGYLGIGYNITDNFDIMIGAGKGWKGDNRVGLFGKWKF
jgi:hypothetical protein